MLNGDTLGGEEHSRPRELRAPRLDFAQASAAALFSSSV